MNSKSIYIGKVRHRRFTPKLHEFSYRLFMFYFDINVISSTFKNIKQISIEKLNWFSFKRRNYFFNNHNSLDKSVREFILKKNNIYPKGKIFLLTHLSCLGYCFNPISLYFIFKENSDELEALLVEVTNTPWGEKHIYFLQEAKKIASHIYQYNFKKELHVSPFMTMNYEYQFNLKINSSVIIVHMESFQKGFKHFDATLSLNLTNDPPIKTFIKFPFITYKVTAAIYWQALKLWLKKIPFYSHPKHEGQM